MNKAQRKQIAVIQASLSDFNEESSIMDYVLTGADKDNGHTRRKAIAAQLDDMRDEVESIEAEEQEKYDNMPESLQAGSKGDEMQTGITALTDAKDKLVEAVEALGNEDPEDDEQEVAEEVAGLVQEAIDELDNVG